MIIMLIIWLLVPPTPPPPHPLFLFSFVLNGVNEHCKCLQDEQDRRIQKLAHQLERARRKCEVYRANLLSVLKDIEDQKLQLSVKVQNIKLGMKDWDLNGIDSTLSLSLSE